MISLASMVTTTATSVLNNPLIVRPSHIKQIAHTQAHYTTALTNRPLIESTFYATHLPLLMSYDESVL